MKRVAKGTENFRKTTFTPEHRDIGAPSFSLSGASGVTASLDRTVRIVDGGVVDTVDLGDTSAYAPFDDYLAQFSDVVYPAGPAAGLENSPFDDGMGGNYWNYTDSAGTFWEVSLTHDYAAPWERLRIERDNTELADFLWAWEEVSGGWVIDSAVATYTVSGGDQFVLTTYRNGYTIARGSAVDAEELLAAVGRVLQATFAVKPLYGVSLVGACDEEWVIFAGLTTFAAYRVAVAVATKSLGDILKAAAATAASVGAGKRLYDCIRDTPTDPDPGD